MTVTKERPVIFSAPMVRAILEGRKSQTRRVVSDSTSQGNFRASDLLLEQAFADSGPSPAGNPGPYLHAPVNCPAICAKHGWTADNCDPAVVERLYPRWFPGDRLWVRETWTADFGHTFSDRIGAWWHEVPRSLRTRKAVECFYFAADESVYHPEAEPGFDERYGSEARRSTWEPTAEDLEDRRWQSPIHMPRWASRITLEITGVRVERLNKISSADAWAEGIRPAGVPEHAGDGDRDLEDPEAAVREEYQNLWDSLNARRGFPWSSNPWVWVLSFRRIGDTE